MKPETLVKVGIALVAAAIIAAAWASMTRHDHGEVVPRHSPLGQR